MSDASKKSIKQADLFGDRDPKPKTGVSELEEAMAKVRNEADLAREAKEDAQESIPSNYAKVELDSNGRLLAPPILHFRNYRLLEAQELGDITEENQEEIFIRILNNMVYEDFDCGFLTLQDVIKILLTIHANFWGPKISSFRYRVKEDLEEPALSNPENISIADLPISNIKFEELKTASAPIIIKTPAGDTYEVRPEVLVDTVVAQRYIEKRYYEEEKIQRTVQKMILKDEPVEPDAMHEYKDFIRRKIHDFALAKRACQLMAKNDSPYDDFGDAFEEAILLDSSFWEAIHTDLKENFDYGINPEVEFDCTINNKPIIRRFLFRATDFIPSLAEKRDSGYTISHG